jgi:GTP-binding protein EngB required for normal cell division
VSRGLEDRLAALGEAAGLAEGRLEAPVVERARAVAERAGRRLGLGLEATVVALAGPTGAGKSSLFNALAGAELATVSPRRPTTSAAAAAVWGPHGEDLLDWLEVPRRHRVEDGGPAGLVLLDLPDFDSVQAAHREEFERLVELVDLVVWVADPQKYADASLHDGYLRPLAGHRATTVLALNQADRLSPGALGDLEADLGRLLRADGLDGVPVLPVSATTGAGVPELRRLVDERVAARTAALERLRADVEASAAGLAHGCEGKGGKVGRAEAGRLSEALAGAAGVPAVVRAVDRAHRRRGSLATGWPFGRWVRRVRPDPLKRLRLGAAAERPEHTGLPRASSVQQGRVDSATRALAESAAGDLAAPWPGLARDAATRSEAEVVDRLDRAVAGTDLRMAPPAWWRLAGGLQLLVAAVTVFGALWLLALAGLAWLRLDDVLPVPEVEGVAVPTLALIGGIVAGLLLALLTRACNAVGARRRASRASRALRREVDVVARESVIEPVEAELEVRRRLCAAAARARER